MLFPLIAFALAIDVVQAQNPGNSTNNCPNVQGFFYKDDCKLLCQKTKWTDVVVFYLGNYIAHAATITTRPGQSTFVTVMTMIGAVLLPGTGIWNGMKAIHSRAKLAPTELRTAARAGALYAVVRDSNSSPDQPSASEDIAPLPASTTAQTSQHQDDPEKQPQESTPLHKFERILNGLESLSTVLLSTNIHGVCELPKGYYLMQVRRDATFKGEHVSKDTRPFYRRLKDMILRCIRPPPSGSNPTLSCNYNLVGALASIIQLIFAVSTLYRTRGDQIERYGYAAFGLTVVPYAWMSFVNLLGNALCPQYDKIYVVRSHALRELEKARERENKNSQTSELSQWKVDGTVGVLHEDHETWLSEDLDKCRGQEHSDNMGAAGIQLEILRKLSKTFSRLERDSTTGDWKSRKPEMALSSLMLALFKWEFRRVDNSFQSTKNNIDQLRQLYKTEFKPFVNEQRRNPSVRAILSWYWRLFKSLLGSSWFVVFAVPFTVVGGLSGFQPGESALFQRVWTMMWLIFGLAVGLILGQALRRFGNKSPNVHQLPTAAHEDDAGFGSLTDTILAAAIYGAVPVGGYVVVTQMLLEFGNCVKVDS